MGVTKQKQMEEMESLQGLKDSNLNKNGEYLNCMECGSKLESFEQWNDNCMNCAIAKND